MEEQKKTGRPVRRPEDTPRRKKPAEKEGRKPAPKAESPEKPKAPKRKPAPKKEAPKREPAKREAPKQEAPKRKAPKRETPKRETPKRAPAHKKHTTPPRTQPKPVSKHLLLKKLLITVAVVLALVLGISIFFRVSQIRVTGNEKYTADQIISVSGIEKGESLLAFGRNQAMGRIKDALPYVDELQVGIRLPGTVIIDVVEQKRTYSIASTDGSFWLMDAEGKLLEEIPQPEAKRHLEIQGLLIEAPVAGSPIRVPEDTPAETEEDGETQPEEASKGGNVQKAEAVREILTTLEEWDHYGQMTRLDVTDLYDIQMYYGEKYQIILGNNSELPYKIRYMVQAVERLEQDGRRGGILDLTFREPGKASFTPW